MCLSYRRKYSGVTPGFPFRVGAPRVVAWSLAVVFVASSPLPALQAQGTAPPPSEPASAAQATTANQEEITILEPGKLIERELAGGQKHKYQIPLSEGQYMKVEVREKGIGVSVSVQRPGEEMLPSWLP